MPESIEKRLVRRGEILRLARNIKGLTESGVGADLGFDRNTVKNWECGRMPSKTFHLYAEYLKLWGWEVDAIAANAPTQTMTPFARSLSGVYWGAMRTDKNYSLGEK